MFRTLLFVVIFSLSQTVFADEQETTFQKGLAAFQAKQFAEAKAEFQKLLDQGVVNAEVLHNSALTNYQLGEKALALGLWRKALTIDPSFRPARSGREFAEGELGQRGFERDQITATLRSLLEFVSVFDLAWAIALFLAISGWLWIRYWGERRAAYDEERPLPAFPSIAVAISVILLASFIFAGLKVRYILRERATIVAKDVSAKSLPADEGVNLFDLKPGSEVIIRRKSEGWAQVQNSDGASGWVKFNQMFITSSL